MVREGKSAIITKSNPEPPLTSTVARDYVRDLLEPKPRVSLLSEPIAFHIKELNSSGFTEIFLEGQFTPEERTEFRTCRWTRIGLNPMLDLHSAVVFMRNPATQDEASVGFQTTVQYSASEFRDAGLLPLSGPGPDHPLVPFLLQRRRKPAKLPEPLSRVAEKEPDDEPTSEQPLETSPDGANILHHVTSGATQVRDKSIITVGGLRYLPLPLAAWMAQTSEASLRNWIDKRVKFGGRSIKTVLSFTKDVYVSEETVRRMSERFVRWPSNDPAGPVTLGQTDDQSGFLALSDAARIIGVSRRTMLLWASEGKAPQGKPLDVIKCTTSDYFYIRERDVFELNALVPRSGLQRGRRPQVSVQP